MGSAQGIDVTALPGDLVLFAQQAEAMARVGVAGLHVSPEKLNTRERAFAQSLRHARGVKAAVAAWQQERAHL